MTTQPTVILSGFADEAANDKTAEQQFCSFAALGLQYYTIRFIDAGKGVKNVMALTKAEITTIRHLESKYGLNVSSLGSPIGKVKLLDKEDGSHNKFIPFDKYLLTTSPGNFISILSSDTTLVGEFNLMFQHEDDAAKQAVFLNGTFSTKVDSIHPFEYCIEG